MARATSLMQRSGPMSPGNFSLAVGGARVRATARSLIVPATSTEEHWLSLSNLDRAVNPTFSSVILFYENIVDTKQSFQDVIRSLKESLSKTLVHFFPLAGRLALREDGVVDIHCNDEGAVFLEATVEADLKSVGGAKPMPALSGLEVARLGPGPNYIPDQLRAMPALVIMVTKFKCGSIAIGANWHHTVADGSSGCHFMKSWAEIASGNSLSLVPNHDRLLLRARDPPNASLVNGYSTTSINIESELGQILETDREQLNQCAQLKKNHLPTEPAVLSSFHVTKDNILRLKEEVSLGSGEGCQFTSAESISAYLWSQMTEARGDESLHSDEEIHSKRDSDTRFFMFVDGRKKLSLPAGYFGNVVCSACAIADEEDILTKPLAFAASLIRKAMKSISGEYFRSLIDWVEIQGSNPSKSEHVNSLGHDVAATFWTFFPLYEMDFGWGRPELAARNSPPRPLIDGIAMMPSARGPGNMVALLNLHSDRMDRLKKRDSFQGIFTKISS